jgi:hypothetical protein
MVTGSVTAGSVAAPPENAPFSGDFALDGVTTPAREGILALMVGTALRPIGHLAAWLVWQATRVSLLEDLERPRPPDLG